MRLPDFADRLPRTGSDATVARTDTVLDALVGNYRFSVEYQEEEE